MKFPKDFHEFLQLLAVHCVDYVIVGGYAVARHGYPRFTGDLDVLVRPTPENAAHLVNALADFGFGTLDITIRDFICPGRVVQLGVPPLRIDLITSIDGVDNDVIFKHRVVDQDQDLSVSFISCADLIKNKTASGRPKDIADVHYLWRKKSQKK